MNVCVEQTLAALGDSGLGVSKQIRIVNSLKIGQDYLLEGFLMTDMRVMVIQCLVETAMTDD